MMCILYRKWVCPWFPNYWLFSQIRMLSQMLYVPNNIKGTSPCSIFHKQSVQYKHNTHGAIGHSWQSEMGKFYCFLILGPGYVSNRPIVPHKQYKSTEWNGEVLQFLLPETWVCLFIYHSILAIRTCAMITNSVCICAHCMCLCVYMYVCGWVYVY